MDLKVFEQFEHMISEVRNKISNDYNTVFHEDDIVIKESLQTILENGLAIGLSVKSTFNVENPNVSQKKAMADQINLVQRWILSTEKAFLIIG